MFSGGAFDGLQAFREELVVKHQQLLNRLDAELEKVKISAPLPPPSYAAKPLPTQPAWTTLQLPGAVDIDTDDASMEEPPKGTEHAQPDCSLISYGSLRKTVAEMRKKKMPWIHKQAPFHDIRLSFLYFFSVLTTCLLVFFNFAASGFDAAKWRGSTPCFLSASWRFSEHSEPPLDLRLKPDVATSRLRSAAIEELPSQDVYRTEIARRIDSKRQEGLEVDPRHEPCLVWEDGDAIWDSSSVVAHFCPAHDVSD